MYDVFLLSSVRPRKYVYYVSELLRNPHNGHFYLVLSYVSYVSSSVLLTFRFEKNQF